MSSEYGSPAPWDEADACAHCDASLNKWGYCDSCDWEDFNDRNE
jgi:hypothetical protein